MLPPLLVALGCLPAPAPVDPPSSVDAQLPCPAAGAQGLAARLWRPAPSKARHFGQTPVILRVGGAGSLGWDVGHDPEDALAQGVAVVQFLRPGTEGEGQASGGEDRFGQPVIDSIGCTVDWLRGAPDLEGGLFRELLADPGVLLLSGLSIGGNASLMAASQGAEVDALLLWESPLVDQLILEEPTGVEGIDPFFTPGSCTLDEGCPFPGRAQGVRWSAELGSLFQDDDADGSADPGERVYEGARELREDAARFYSRELWAEAESHAFVEVDRPSWWPTASVLDDFWAGWDASAALRAARDEGQGPPTLYLARAEDHVQLVHDHVLLAQEGLAGLDFFRLNPDASYVEALSGERVSEQPAGMVLTELEALPMMDLRALVLGAELELLDRAALELWAPDLEAPLLPTDPLPGIP